jgi:predicted CoA-binding protein
MVGLSSNPFRPSHFAAIYLISEGYEVIPVNPRESQVLGRPCYPSLAAIPGPVACQNLVVCRMAGKPFVYDHFWITQLVETGRMTWPQVEQFARGIGRRHRRENAR